MIHIKTAELDDGDECQLYYLVNDNDEPVEFDNSGDVFMYSVHAHARKACNELEGTE